MILGLAFSHNATACLLEPDTGRCLFCCSEERFSRRKNEWGIPRRTLEYIFRHVAPAQDITRVAVGESCRGRWGSCAMVELLYLGDWDTRDRYITSLPRLAWTLGKEAAGRLLRPRDDYRGLVQERLREMGITAPVEFHDHHRAHAASAFYCSPFDQALVVTLDGEGDSLSGSVWLGRGGRLELINTLPEVASVGKFYRAVTSLLGFKVNRHEGKVTGLAAYGDPERFAPLFRELLAVTPAGEHRRLVSQVAQAHLARFNLRRVNPLRLARFAGLLLRAQGYEDLLNQMLRENFRSLYGPRLGIDLKRPSFRDMADVSAAAQQVLEEVVCDWVAYHQSRVETRNLALAGGVFANVKLNQRLLERLDTEAIYIHPGMGDEGLALGGALLAAQGDRTRRLPRARLEHVFLGPAYDDRQVRAALAASGFAWQKASPRAIAQTVSRALQQERIVGLFRGRLEYGPRALGHRTILVNPVKREINDVVNRRLRRSEFMPFAPVVLEECYQEIFASAKLAGAREAASYMTITLDVKPAWRERIAGVVHVDGTARPQVIRPQDDAVYYAIVERFHRDTGLGCMVNTSFNLHEEPIVNTPAEALKSFAQGAVDLLVMEDYIVRRPRGES
jgi:carbamoyltransferase